VEESRRRKMETMKKRMKKEGKIQTTPLKKKQRVNRLCKKDLSKPMPFELSLLQEGHERKVETKR
jgi:hypothetical protein